MPYLVGYATPYDYGAAGNGSTDDTTAVQNAINGVSATGGGTLFFPAGTYKISSALSVPNGVSLLGVGQNVSVINQTSTTANAITYNPSTLNYVSIENLSITGPGSGSGIGILVEANGGATNVNSCSFQDVTIAGFGSHGLELVTGVGCSLNTVNVSSVGGHGIFLSGGTGNTLTNCFVTGGASTQQGFQLTNVNYTTLNGCKAFSCGGGYTISGGSANAITGCGADTIVAANGQDGSGFKISGGTVHTIDSCYSNVNKAKAFYATGSTVAATIESIQENAPGGGATASIQVDSGSTAVVVESSTVTATSYAAGTTTVITGGTIALVGPIAATPTASGNTLLSSNINGADTFDRFRLLGSGAMAWGPGTGARDTTLQRPTGGGLTLTQPSGLVETLAGLVQAQSSTVTVSNTITATALSSFTVPANDPAAGSVYRVEGYGVYSTTGTPTLQFILYWGGTTGTVLASIPAVTLPSSITNAPFRYQATVTFRSTTSAVAQLALYLDTSTTTDSVSSYLAVPSSATTVTTTSANALAVGVTWGTASSSNTISLLGGTVDRVA